MMVKICGITNREDAVAAAEAGASAIGFNFWSGSPRCIQPSKAATIGEGLNVLKVGVFVDESPELVRETVRIAALDIVQLHGSEATGPFTGLRIWKAYRVRNGWSAQQMEAVEAEAVLLDGPVPGSGVGFDWKVAAGLARRVILAGGLGPDNVAEAIRQVRPWGVDACSKLEKAPGIKDHERVERFIKAAVTVSL